ncbi:Six-hairpin glycosidase-like protein [Halenospora varia]|nr:Six-hairpin glycosidase-like protein [Halenospora varia]
MIPSSFALKAACALVFLHTTEAILYANQYNLSPTSRSIKSVGIFRTTGNVESSNSDKHEINSALDKFQLTGPNSSLTFDFGKMVAGVVSLNISNPSCNGLGLAFSESEQFVGFASDHSIFFNFNDGTLFIPMEVGLYTLPDKWSRGSFRYLTVSLGNTTVASTSITVAFNNLRFDASPDRLANQLQQYTGSFYSSNDLLNRMWYAGVYTLQLCTVAANTSINHAVILDGVGWSNDDKAANLTGSDVYLSDGAKRDRTSWSGDLGVSMRSAYVAYNYDRMQSSKNLIRAYMVVQNQNTSSPTYGYFPYPGSPFAELLYIVDPTNGPYTSDTYHLWAIAGWAEIVLVTGDISFGNKYFGQIVQGIQATYKFVNNSTGLFNGTRTSDWGRNGGGGQNIALNALYYHTLTRLSQVSSFLTPIPGANAEKWSAMAAKVKTSANTLLFDSSAGLYKDNTTATGAQLYPLDGNYFAINFNLTTSPAQSQRISKSLAARLTKFGSPTPEAVGVISPFISSHELRAQFLANPGDASQAMSLMRTQWGYMLSAFSNSTFVEGYSTDGRLSYAFYGPENDALISHAHAWSTGPVFSLQNFILGIQASPIDVAPGDGQWAYQPRIMGSGLSFAKGGFVVAMGEFSSSWSMEKNCFKGTFTNPEDTMGTLYVPTFGSAKAKITVNGKAVACNGQTGPFVRMPNMPGGTYAISVTY